jgi:hypothetical protein
MIGAMLAWVFSFRISASGEKSLPPRPPAKVDAFLGGLLHRRLRSVD